MNDKFNLSSPYPYIPVESLFENGIKMCEIDVKIITLFEQDLKVTFKRWAGRIMALTAK